MFAGTSEIYVKILGHFLLPLHFTSNTAESYGTKVLEKCYMGSAFNYKEKKNLFTWDSVEACRRACWISLVFTLFSFPLRFVLLTHLTEVFIQYYLQSYGSSVYNNCYHFPCHLSNSSSYNTCTVTLNTI